jgi:conjugative transfer region protein (TIGR03748 family)
MRLLTLIFLSLISLKAFSHSHETDISSNDIYKVGRYSSVSTEPTHAQLDLLSVIIELDFPRSINTVGSALKFMLLNSGYRLAEQNVSDPNLKILLSSPLPNVHRSLGPISLRTALNTLSGTSWDLIVDPVHRLISFELIDDFRYSFEAKEVSHD